MSKMMMNKTPRSLTLAVMIIGIIFLSIISACGGSSSGDPSPDDEAQTTVSGSVQAPDGQFASNQQKGLLQYIAALVIAEANTAVSGLSPVTEGAVVELIRIDTDGTILATLATTTVSSGTYSFNLTKLGLNFSGDLVVRAVGTGVQMRAVVVGEQ